ncbi:hypothetical protein [Lysobacter fragariae]
MKSMLVGATLLVASLVFGCAAGQKVNGGLSARDIQVVLAKEGLSGRSVIEQQPQDADTVLLLVTGNFRDTHFSGCYADSTDLELSRSALNRAWRVKSRNNFAELSLLPCSVAVSSGFASVEGGLDDKQLEVAVGQLKRLLQGSLSGDRRVSFSSPELDGAVDHVGLKDLESVFFQANGDIRFQFVCSELLPRLLRVRIRIENGELERIEISAEDGIEIIER